MGCVSVQVIVLGSNSSTEAWFPSSENPPTIRILPSFNVVAVWRTRSLPMESTVVQVPDSGSYNSAELLTPCVPNPPDTRTLPSCKEHRCVLSARFRQRAGLRP
jgi:hypothetical protein